MFPGNLEYPYSSTGSPPMVFIKGVNWLYSTPIVNSDPLLCFNRQIAPHASPGFLATVIEFNYVMDYMIV